ncbi:hypothetical protein [Zoogloea sp.]|uniref:hypothetical protein n=1 Tax=Zoogloea sp. TaxID=49181 RepID=UPI00261EFF1F|nr:hypothetical protein [Zoogloea sp.]MDD3352832.1 hypothetical protein [Zoogloea sp.]
MNVQMSFDFPEGAGVPAGLPSTAIRRTARTKPSELAPPDCSQLPLVVSPVRTPARPRPGLRSIPQVESRTQGLHSSRAWSDGSRHVRILRSESGDWAAEVWREEDREHVLMLPWPYDDDSLAPRPLDAEAFQGLVREADRQWALQARQLQARLHQRLTIPRGNKVLTVTLDIVPDEFEPHALLSAVDDGGEVLAREQVGPDFRLTAATARAWVEKAGSGDVG